MKLAILAVAAATLMIGAAFAEELEPGTHIVPLPDTNIESVVEHGSLPGGDNTKWTRTEGELTIEPWETTDGPTETAPNTTVELQSRDVEQTNVAVNPGGNTPGTTRFNEEKTWTENQAVIVVTAPVVVVVPTNPADACKDGGYVALGFSNQGRCVSSFN